MNMTQKSSPKKKRTKKAAPQSYEAILESISDGVFTVDERWRVTSFNRAAETITGIPREEALGKPCSEVFRASVCEAACALRHTMETGHPLVNRSCYIINSEGNRIPISVSTALLRNNTGEIVGGAETFRDLSVVEELRKELEGRFEMGDIVSRSPAMRRFFDILPQVAASDSTVLIQGETGTGKELLARAIHHLSPREKHPFVAVNCGALPDTLLESELFGYKAGAFTGAEKDKPGRFALAEGGTLLLDEIGDITPALQVRLLRALQERAYEPLGATASVNANVRVIAASNKDLAQLVEKGAFRSDLFYRVNVVRMELPPLRQRKEDIPLLVERFIAKLNRLQDRNISGVTPEAMAVLMAYEYPGNIRELENILEHAFVLCTTSDMIDAVCLPEHLGARAAADSGSIPLTTAVQHAEAQSIRDALRRNQGNRLAAAQELGMHKSTLFRKMKRLGINSPKSTR